MSLRPNPQSNHTFMKILLPILLLISSLLANSTPAESLASLEQSFAKRSADFAKPKGKALEGADREKPLLNLRYLLEMEAILREFGNDQAAIQKQVDIDELSDSEKRRLIELRTEANEYRASALSDPEFEEPRTNPREKLHKAFERKARKPLMEISKSRKTLNREYERNSPDDRKIDKIQAEIDQQQSELQSLRIAFFGNIPGKGFEAPIDPSSKGPAADLLKKVITARDQLLIALRLDPKQQIAANDGEIKNGEVGGIKVRSSKLGVVLDHSTSMQPHLPALRKEIDQGFPGSLFREVYGCALTWTANPKVLGKRDHVLLAMEDLIIVKGTDALYWFSDLRDAATPAGLTRLTELLDRSGALLYVSSVDQKPKDELEELITGFKKK